MRKGTDNAGFTLDKLIVFISINEYSNALNGQKPVWFAGFDKSEGIPLE